MTDWRDIHGDQNLRMANKMLEQQGEINDLKAERDKYKGWNDEARRQLAGDQGRIAGMQERLRQASNLIALLSGELKAAKPVLGAAEAWRAWFPHHDSMFVPENTLIAAVDGWKNTTPGEPTTEEIVCLRCGGRDGMHVVRNCELSAQYAHARCGDWMLHQPHVWGDPKHWCTAEATEAVNQP